MVNVIGFLLSELSISIFFGWLSHLLYESESFGCFHASQESLSVFVAVEVKKAEAASFGVNLIVKSAVCPVLWYTVNVNFLGVMCPFALSTDSVVGFNIVYPFVGGTTWTGPSHSPSLTQIE